MSIDLKDANAFKIWNFKYFNGNVENIIVESLAVLIGNYNILRKKAAMLILTILLKDEFLKSILNDETELYPISRNDSRVSKWTKKIISIGHCEKCGTTKNLQAHHILKWSEFPLGRIDIENGMCLCVSCHADEHKADGIKNLIKSRFLFC